MGMPAIVHRGGLLPPDAAVKTFAEFFVLCYTQYWVPFLVVFHAGRNTTRAPSQPLVQFGI